MAYTLCCFLMELLSEKFYRCLCCRHQLHGNIKKYAKQTIELQSLRNECCLNISEKYQINTPAKKKAVLQASALQIDERKFKRETSQLSFRPSLCGNTFRSDIINPLLNAKSCQDTLKLNRKPSARDSQRAIYIT